MDLPPATRSDPSFSLTVAPGNEFVIFENSAFRAEYRNFFADHAQFGLRYLYYKSAGGADLICGDCGPHHYLDADAGRGTLVDAVVLRDDANQKTVRFVWRGAFDASRRITHEVSIFPNLPLIQIDYIDVQFGTNTVDLARPGGSLNNSFIAHGADNWVRGYVTHDYAPTVGSYYNRYPGDGVNDPPDGGSLNYNGNFIVGVYNAPSGVGFGRVMTVADNAIVKLLLSQSEKRGLEFFPHPFGLAHAPFTGYLFFVTGGEQDILDVGRLIADGAFESIGCGTAGDSDGDGVCDDVDVCPGGDDTIDLNGNGTPDACECPGDLDGDLSIDLNDLATLLSNFDLSPATPAQGDIDGDGLVGLSDLALLLSAFGTPCP